MMIKKIEPKEALKVLKDNIHYSLYELNEATKNDTNSRLIRSIRALDELVNKAKPEKVIKWLSDGSMACCPWCHGAEYAEERHNYCHFCGKALDWCEND